MDILSKRDLDNYMNSQSGLFELEPIKLHFHMRSICSVKISPDEKYLVTSSKDKTPALWNIEDGKLLGIYNHQGAVWSVDINKDSNLLVTGSADQSTRLWNLTTGELLKEIEHESASRFVSFGNKSDTFVIVTDNLFGEIPKVTVVTESSQKVVYESDIKINVAIFNEDDSKIYICDEEGNISIITSTGNIVAQIHNGNCKSIRFSTDFKTLITAGSDQTAKLLDPRDLIILKEYKNSFPVNQSILVNDEVKDHVILAGGIESSLVTNSESSKFDISFYSVVFENKLGSFNTHFGPVNSLDMSRSGKYLVSAGEDGFVYIYNMSKLYYL
uniref:Serine-threonine kinase receptor-associated protein n=1 Tax=viral metagenome TaxID=1070528 RepID=A0A6C0LLV6_9ZZZZ